MAAGDLTTVANVKQWLNVTSNTDDSLLQRLLSAESANIQNYLNRQFAVTAYTDTINGQNTLAVHTVNYPIVSVASVTIDGQLIPQSTDPTVPGWVFDLYSVRLVPWQYRFTNGQQNISIQYTAGYASVPLDLEQACIELVALRYRERSRIGVNTQTLGQETTSYQNIDMPPSVKTALAQYKKVVPV
jgi:uncharacterized phiE125 gp8 family phage protein